MILVVASCKPVNTVLDTHLGSELVTNHPVLHFPQQERKSRELMLTRAISRSLIKGSWNLDRKKSKTLMSLFCQDLGSTFMTQPSTVADRNLLSRSPFVCVCVCTCSTLQSLQPLCTHILGPTGFVPYLKKECAFTKELPQVQQTRKFISSMFVWPFNAYLSTLNAYLSFASCPLLLLIHALWSWVVFFQSWVEQQQQRPFDTAFSSSLHLTRLSASKHRSADKKAMHALHK
jgi:hypothetical protein